MKSANIKFFSTYGKIKIKHLTRSVNLNRFRKENFPITVLFLSLMNIVV